MTVQQERPTVAAAPPEPRSAERDEQVDAVPPRVPGRPGAWPTPEDRLICRWMMVGMLVLGLYAALFVWLGARVFG